MNHDDRTIVKVDSPDSRIAGYYAVDSLDKCDPSAWTWRDSGNGPEVVTAGVNGPFATAAEVSA